MTADQRHHLSRAIPGGVQHDLALDLRLVRRHGPFVVGVLLERGDALVATHARAHLARCCSHRCGDLGRVDVAIERVPQCADEVVGLEERVAVLQFLRREDVIFHAVGSRHRGDVLELGHALVGVCESHRTGDVVVDRVFGVLGEFAIQLGRVLLDLHDAPAARVGRHVAGCVPGGAGRQLVALQEQHVRAAHLGQVVQGAHARDAAANDHDSCAFGHVFPRCRR